MGREARDPGLVQQNRDSVDRMYALVPTCILLDTISTLFIAAGIYIILDILAYFRYKQLMYLTQISTEIICVS